MTLKSFTCLFFKIGEYRIRHQLLGLIKFGIHSFKLIETPFYFFENISIIIAFFIQIIKNE
jgi:hypothetical protein